MTKPPAMKRQTSLSAILVSLLSLQFAVSMSVSMSSLRMRPVILLFGDSITQQGFGIDGHTGWASLLANDYIRRADVLNRGYSGYNTRHCVELVLKVFGSAPEMLFCTVLLGANDAALPGERQHVPIDEYEENLGKIVTGIRQTTQQPELNIILMTPPPFDAPAWDANKPLPESGSRSNDAAKAYGERVKLVGTKYNCHVVDLFQLMGGNGNDYGHFLSDGLHLNGSGNAKVYEGLMDLIQRELPHLAPEQVPMDEKLWTDLC